MSLRLVMTRNVGGEDMAEAFDGALRPRVRLVASREPGGEAALGTFRNLFSLDKLTKGTVLDFTCTPDGTLSSSVGGEQKPASIEGAVLGAVRRVSGQNAYHGPRQALRSRAGSRNPGRTLRRRLHGHAGPGTVTGAAVSPSLLAVHAANSGAGYHAAPVGRLPRARLHHRDVCLDDVIRDLT
jgi:hypothetical protein